jgi:hypothetical protein
MMQLEQLQNKRSLGKTRNKSEGAVDISVNTFKYGMWKEITQFWDQLGGVYILVFTYWC